LNNSQKSIVLIISKMLLECQRVNISIPKSTPISLIFPFDQCSYRFKRHCYDPQSLDKENYTVKDINLLLDKVEEACNNFRVLRRFRNIAIMSAVFLAFAIIIGSIFVNIGTSRGKDNGVEFVKFQTNGFVYAGGIILFLGLLQFGLIMCYLAFKARRLRIVFEEKSREILEKTNADIKDLGIRWKLGQLFNWLELSLDYKVEGTFMVNTKGFNTLLIPQKI
jgi:hypothetical protein